MDDKRIFGIEIDGRGAVKVLDDLDKGFGKVGNSSAATDGKLRDTNGRFLAAQKGAKSLGGELGSLKTRYLGVAAVAGAVAAAVAGSVKEFTQFETAIAEVNTLLGDNQRIDEYTKSVRELSKQFGTDNVQQAQALYQVISAGASDATEATNILTAANKLAIGGVTDIETAADGLTSVLNAYSLSSSEAGKVSDILFATMRSGKTTIGELSSSIGQVAPLASQLGVGFDELTAALATITTSGVKTSQAVTQIRAALANVLKPSKEASELAAQLGINFTSAGLKAQGLSGFLDTVATATGGSEEQLAKLFGSVEAVQAVMPLAGAQAEKFGEILNSNANSAGETQRAYNILADTTGKNFDRLQAKVSDLALSFGSFLAPAVNLGIDVLEGVVEVVAFIGEGLGLLIDLIAPLVQEFAKLTPIAVAWNELNGEIQDSTTFLGVFAESFRSVEVFGAKFIEGALIGFEKIKFAAGASALFFENAYLETVDKVLEAIATPNRLLRESLQDTPFEGLADDIDIFSGALENSKKRIAENEKAFRDLNAETDKSIATIREITADTIQYHDESRVAADATKEVGEESKSTAKELDNLGQKTDDTKTSLKELNAATKLSVNVIKDVARAAQEAGREAERLAKATGTDLLRSQQELNRVFDESQLKLKNQGLAYQQVVDFLTGEKGLIKGTKEYEEALEAMGVRSEEEATKIEGLWEQTTDSIFDAWQGFFRDGLDGWDSFTDSIEDIFKDLIASLLAQWAASGIVGLLSGEGFSGFSLNNAFGNGSSADCSVVRHHSRPWVKYSASKQVKRSLVLLMGPAPEQDCTETCRVSRLD